MKGGKEGSVTGIRKEEGCFSAGVARVRRMGLGGVRSRGADVPERPIQNLPR